MEKKIDELIEELNSIGIDLFNKFGSDSYNQRCRIYDVKYDLEQLKAELKEQHKKDVEINRNDPKESGYYYCYIEEVNDLGTSKYIIQCYFDKDKDFDRWTIKDEPINKVVNWFQLP